MANFFSYLNSPLDAPPPDAPRLTQPEEQGVTALAIAATEAFDKVAEADIVAPEGDGPGEWILLDPTQIFAGESNKTPTDRLVTVAASASIMLPQTRRTGATNTPTTAHRTALRDVNQPGGGVTPEHAAGNLESVAAPTTRSTSALVTVSHHDTTIKTSMDLVAFLEW
jgi:hypothetical protein